MVVFLVSCNNSENYIKNLYHNEVHVKKYFTQNDSVISKY